MRYTMCPAWKKPINNMNVYDMIYALYVTSS